jgi:hypothetical protein
MRQLFVSPTVPTGKKVAKALEAAISDIHVLDALGYWLLASWPKT